MLLNNVAMLWMHITVSIAQLVFVLCQPVNLCIEPWARFLFRNLFIKTLLLDLVQNDPSSLSYDIKGLQTSFIHTELDMCRQTNSL